MHLGAVFADRCCEDVAMTEVFDYAYATDIARYGTTSAKKL